MANLENNIFSESFTLPSLGKCYEPNIDPVVTLRSMTTNDEMKRLSNSERQYKVMCDVVDDCIMNNLGISSYDMILADYQFLVHKLRIVTYGSDYRMSSKCPYCGHTSEHITDLDSFEVETYDEEKIAGLLEFTLPKTGHKIKLKLQTPRMLDDIQVRANEIMKKSHNKSGDRSLALTIEYLIASIDDEKVNPVTISQWVETLPLQDANYILRHAEKIAERVGLITEFNLRCDICGLTYTSNFRTTSEFFGPQIDI